MVELVLLSPPPSSSCLATCHCHRSAATSWSAAGCCTSCQSSSQISSVPACFLSRPLTSYRCTKHAGQCSCCDAVSISFTRPGGGQGCVESDSTAPKRPEEGERGQDAGAGQIVFLLTFPQLVIVPSLCSQNLISSSDTGLNAACWGGGGQQRDSQSASVLCGWVPVVMKPGERCEASLSPALSPVLMARSRRGRRALLCVTTGFPALM